MFINNVQHNKDLRRKLRKNLTEAERKIWNIVRNRKMQGYKFFRQYGLLNFIVDFYCPQLKLCIEIDGGQHNKEKNGEYDKFRSEELASLGIRTIRFWNNEVINNIEGVYQIIQENINSSLPPL